MKKVYIGTNWKMTKTLTEGLSYTQNLLEASKDLNENIQLFIIPSYTLLAPIKSLITDSRIHLGAQNMHWEERGAYTGEISPLMLSDIGIDMVELGHSERREYYNENDEDINKKVLTALRHRMNPLVCIGENLYQKENNLSVETLSAQLKVCLKDLEEEDLSNVLVAYEPVWAIGEKGMPAEAEYVAYIHSEIRRILTDLFGKKGNNIPILFGGSVNTTNFMGYLKSKDVDGLFIGRAAWDMTTFREILKDINRAVTDLVNQ
jgi:L-erythrulose 1-phosphate isomerase